jgi:hypothetical protein
MDISDDEEEEEKEDKKEKDNKKEGKKEKADDVEAEEELGILGWDEDTYPGPGYIGGYWPNPEA